MKKILLPVLAILVTNTSAFSWAFQGHATIAKVAENHLDPQVKELITSYFGGISMVAFASDADILRDRWLMELDFKPINPKQACPNVEANASGKMATYGHIMLVDGNFEPVRSHNADGEYVQNACLDCADIIKELKASHKTMDPERRHMILAELIHLVGDFHCPDHVGLPCDHQAGWFDITFMGRKMKRHQLWDGILLDNIAPWGFEETARFIDTYTDEQIAQVTKGDIWDYGKASAIACLHTHNVPPGAALPRAYAADERLFVFSQLRNAGYRLAAILNDIFKQ